MTLAVGALLLIAALFRQCQSTEDQKGTLVERSLYLLSNPELFDLTELELIIKLLEPSNAYTKINSSQISSQFDALTSILIIPPFRKKFLSDIQSLSRPLIDPLTVIKKQIYQSYAKFETTTFAELSNLSNYYQ